MSCRSNDLIQLFYKETIIQVFFPRHTEYVGRKQGSFSLVFVESSSMVTLPGGSTNRGVCPRVNYGWTGGNSLKW
jgi:hypothetical protein